MPRNPNLLWTELKDFSAGLWTSEDSFLMPPTGLQTMEDCYPRKGGGVRAFFKPTALTVSGITSTTNELPIAFATQQLPDLSSYMLLLTKVVATGGGYTEGQIKAYYKTSAAGAWTLTKTFAAASPAAYNAATVTPYQDASNIYYLVVAINNSGADIGTWTFRPDTNVWAKITAVGIGPVINHQGRIVVATTTSGTIIWTDPGGVTFPAANDLDLYQGMEDFRIAISSMVATPPDQLQIFTANDRVWNVNGDIDDPIVTGMNQGRSPNILQNLASTNDGPVFLEMGVGVTIVANNGGVLDRYDPQLAPTPNFPSPVLNHFPYPGFAKTGGFLFTPDGRVREDDTNGWFSLSQSTSSKPVLYFAKNLDGSVVGLQWGAGWVPYIWAWSGEPTSTQARAESYTIKTAPLHTTDARQADVEEVEVWIDSFHANTTIAVTVNGTTRTSAAVPAGHRIVPFRFRERAAYLDIKLVAASNNAGTEAPIIEAVRIGTRKDAHEMRAVL